MKGRGRSEGERERSEGLGRRVGRGGIRSDCVMDNIKEHYQERPLWDGITAPRYS